MGRGLRSAAELVEMGFAPARVAAAMDASVGDVVQAFESLMEQL